MRITNPTVGVLTLSLSCLLFSSAEAASRLTSSAVAGSEAAAVGSEPTPLPAAPAGDFDLDGTPDVLWFNAARGEFRVWLMQGFRPHTEAALAFETGDPMVQAAGTADFNGDGMSDLLLWNPNTGAISIVYMRGLEAVSKVELDLRVADRVPVSVYDFDQDGGPDILWQNKGGELLVTVVRGGMIVTKYEINVPSTGPAELWLVRGSGDFDGDGDHDLLVERAADIGTSPDGVPGTTVGIIFMHKTNGSLMPIAVKGDRNFEIGAVADYDRDGDPDVLFENDATGVTAAWVMASVKVEETVIVAPAGTIRPGYDMVGPR